MRLSLKQATRHKQLTSESEPCPYCDEFIDMPENGNDYSWYQCPNCGEFFYVNFGDSDYVAWHGYTAESAARQRYLPANSNTVPATAPMAVSTKAANAHAKAGETIIGNLVRGSDGKFSSGGASHLTDQEKQDIKDRVEALRTPKGKGRKSGGKGKTAKPKKEVKTPEQRKAEQEQKRLENVQNLAPKLGLGLAGDAIAESDLTGPDIDNLNDAAKAALVDKGLASSNPDGSINLTGAGKSLISALGRGDSKAAQNAIRSAGKNNLKKSASRAARLAKAQAKVDQLKTGKAFNGSLQIFKDFSGRYRWITFSSSSYKDRDKQIVSQKALESDCERADLDQDYGPLRWWHIPGFDIGDCDYSSMMGRVLVESGTFHDERVAVAIKNSSDKLEVSLGFYHPIIEPDSNGVFNFIRKFERSLMTAGYASNLFTGVLVTEQAKENEMTLKERLDKFVATLGGGSEAEGIAAEVLDRVEAAHTKATEQKISTKAADPSMQAADAAGQDPAAETPGEYIGDITPAEFWQQLTGIVKSAIAEATGGMATKAELQTALATPNVQATKQAAELTTLKAQAAVLNQRIAQLESSVANLESDAPAITGYRASVADNTITKTKNAAPSLDELDDISRVAATVGGSLFGGMNNA